MKVLSGRCLERMFNMTKKQALQEIAELKKQNKPVLDLTFKSECVPYVKEEIVKFEFSDKHFHRDKNNEIVDYTKNVILEIGLLAGIEVIESISQKLSTFAYTSTCFVKRKMPTGHVEQMSADYEFDAEIRFQIEEANDIIYQNGKKYTKKSDMVNKAMKVRRIAEMAVHGKSRADTGAQKRAIIKILQIPGATTKYKNQYAMPNTIAYISKIVPNLDNSEMRQLYLNNMAGIASQITTQHQEPKMLPSANEANDKPADNPPGIIKQENNEFEFTDIEADADAGFESAGDEITIREFFNSDIVQKNKYLYTILDYILKNSHLHNKASIIIDTYQSTDILEEKYRCIIRLYLEHDKIKNYQNGAAVKFLGDILKAGDESKLQSSIITCYNVVTRKDG